MPQSENLTTPDDDPQWYKDAIIYQTHVRAFADSDGDGIGDFRGLTGRLDYLQNLGVTAIWLLPFYPSPLRDDGYDIADYMDVNPAYGTLKDFKVFLREAHARGLKVITELVLNHTSDQHAWFQKERLARPGNPENEFYVWSDTVEKYQDARIIFKDFETSNWAWDPVAKAYYWHRFYSHQPDLNFDNPRVQEALFQIIDYWLKMGVDGLRLDAVPYLHEREGTNCENLPETHQVLKDLRKHIDEKFPNRMLLAEANQWPEDAIAYFGDGDECHTAFHFPVMPRMFMAIQMEDRFPIIDIMQQTPAIPANCQWVLFLRNHDELTLEMVTDEERDYMYRVYARDRQARINLGIRRRLAPLLSNNRRKIELMNGLLFSLPGTPVIYYGDEIGMGDNIYLGDRDGVRTPMQWSDDRNAGFSTASPQRLYLPTISESEYHFESINVETQRNNPQSLWWWMKRLIAKRQLHPAFGRGTLEFLSPSNAKVLAFVRCYQDECVLVVANLSRFVQYTELDLSAYEGRRPVELFGHSKFPAISKQPYLLTMGPHAFYWFVLERVATAQPAGTQPVELPRLSVRTSWEELFTGRGKSSLERVLMDRLPERRWFGGKARTIQGLLVTDAVPLGVVGKEQTVYLTMVRVEYVEGEPETYVMPLGFVAGAPQPEPAHGQPSAPLARIVIRDSKQTGQLVDAFADPAFAAELLEIVASKKQFKGQFGEVVAWSNQVLQRAQEGLSAPLTPSVQKADQSNSSVLYGERLFLKLFRKVDNGINPDLEIGQYLTEIVSFAHVPAVAGAIEYHTPDGPLTLGVLQAFAPNEGTAWRYTLDSLDRYFEHILAQPEPIKPQDQIPPGRSLLEMASGIASGSAKELIGIYLQSAELLGKRTAELHLALASHPERPDFAPEPFTQLYQRSMYQSMRKSSAQQLQLLRKQLPALPPAVANDAQLLIERDREIQSSIQSILKEKIAASRMRIHGDYHLGQVLYTGKDFTIIDFEGEPARSLSERRFKRSALQDVAGMLRSFHYAARTALGRQLSHAASTPGILATLNEAARFWYLWTSSSFLKSYLAVAGKATFVPQAPAQLDLLLRVLLLDKAIYELGYELNNRPDWVNVPLRGILDLLDAHPSAAENARP